MEKDCKEVDVRLTPEWWEDKLLTVEDAYVVIPDTEYDNDNESIDYGDEGEVDFNTGVIVKDESDIAVGYWCHYRAAGPYIFHPFRERFSNGEVDKFEGKSARLVKKDDMVLITDKKIF